MGDEDMCCPSRLKCNHKDNKPPTPLKRNVRGIKTRGVCIIYDMYVRVIVTK